MSRLFGWSYPPGVTGNEPEITGGEVCTLDWDAEDVGYIGDDDAGAYHGALWDGHEWWATVEVDAEYFVETVISEPYQDEAEAREAARNAARDWWAENGGAG